MGGPPEYGGWEFGISEEDVYVVVICEYQDKGKGDYGPQGVFQCQISENHPNGQPKEVKVWFDNSTLGTDTSPSKVRQIANVIKGSEMPQAYADENGLDPEDLIGGCFRVLLRNKVKGDKTYINSDDKILKMGNHDKIEVRDYKKLDDRGNRSNRGGGAASTSSSGGGGGGASVASDGFDDDGGSPTW